MSFEWLLITTVIPVPFSSTIIAEDWINICITARILNVSYDGLTQCVYVIILVDFIHRLCFLIKTTAFRMLVLFLSSGDRWEEKALLCWALLVKLISVVVQG
jgi:hypothetical protein